MLLEVYKVRNNLTLYFAKEKKISLTVLEGAEIARHLEENHCIAPTSGFVFPPCV